MKKRPNHKKTVLNDLPATEAWLYGTDRRNWREDLMPAPDPFADFDLLSWSPTEEGLCREDLEAVWHWAAMPCRFGPSPLALALQEANVHDWLRYGPPTAQRKAATRGWLERIGGWFASFTGNGRRSRDPAPAVCLSP